MSSLLKVLLIVGGLIVLAVVGFVVWVLTLPEGGVKLANEMDEYAHRHLEEHKILNSTEKLIAYYDVTVSMTGDESAILTNERVLYHKQGRTTALSLAEVTDVQHHYETLIGDVIVVQGATGESMKIEIAPMNGGETFLNALQKAWKLAAPGRQPPPANP
ncbi:MAG: hypothetical protein ACRD4D_01020 [Candidatus Acidiferrales bacterium]